MRTRVRVISLRSALARREAFEKQAADCGISWSHFDAHTELTPDLIYDEKSLIGHHMRPLTRPERGCYSSHFAVWTEFANSDDDQLLVFEDDVQIDWTYAKRVVENDFAAAGIDYVRLASSAIPSCFNKGEYLDRYLYQFVGYALGSQAYLLTRRGARMMLAHCRRVMGPIDLVIDQSWRGNVACFALFPYAIMATSPPSTIGSERYGMLTKSSEWPMTLRAQRWLFRIDDGLRRRVLKLLVAGGFGARVKADARWV